MVSGARESKYIDHPEPESPNDVSSSVQDPPSSSLFQIPFTPPAKRTEESLGDTLRVVVYRGAAMAGTCPESNQLAAPSLDFHIAPRSSMLYRMSPRAWIRD
jgi:hypothetical protein